MFYFPNFRIIWILRFFRIPLVFDSSNITDWK